MLALMQRARTRDDRVVVRRVLSGNLSAFRVLVDRYGGVVHGVAYARLRNTADAEDVAQETFIRFYQQLDQLAHRRHVGSWLVRVARNVSVDVLRKRLREAERTKGLVVAQAAVPGPVREELHRLLWDEIEKLEPDAQEVIVLHYFMKKKAREIASLLDINTNAAEKRLQRAREELGCRLTDVLGGELGELKADARRADRIMAAVCAAPAIWKASAGAATAAGTAAGVATGAGAAKVSAGLAAVVLVAVLGYFLFDRYFYPYSTQDITAKSTVTMADSALVAAPEPKEVETSAEPAESAAPEAAAPLPVYPRIFGVVTGKVSYEDGTPASGAQVWLDNEPAVRRYENIAAMGIKSELVEAVNLSTSADSAGRYSISEIPLSVSADDFSGYTVYASKGGLFGQGLFDGNHLEREKKLDLMLLNADLQVGGIVRGRNGRPVSGATVGFGEFVPSRGGYNGFLAYSATGPDGKFLFDHLPPASLRLSVRAEGYLSYVSPWMLTGVTDFVAQLDEGSSVSGRVINVETGEAVGDVLVQGREVVNDPQKGYRMFDGEADSGGVFRITGCEPGVYQLSVEPKRYQASPLTLVEPLTVTVGAQPVSGLELKMATGGVLRGRVIDDETGLPAPVGSEVWASVQPGGSHMRGCETGAGGAYELLGLHEGELTLVATGAPLSRMERYKGTVTLKAGEVKENYDIHLPPHRFGGRVVDESGNPVPGASVYAVPSRTGFEVATAVTDTAGRFRFNIVRPDTPASVYLQALAADGYSATAGPFRTNVQNRDIVLRLIRSGRLEGDVADQDGRPVKRIVIALVPESADALIPKGNLPFNEGRSINKPSRDGRFVFTRLHPGRYTLEVRSSWGVDRPFATTDATIEAGRTTTAHLVVDMSEFGAVEGVVLADGKPASNQPVVVEHTEYSGGTSETTGPDGFYSIRGVLPGEVHVTVRPPYGLSGVREMQTAEVVSGEVTTVDFNLSSNGGATGSVEGYVMSGGSPAWYTYVTLEPAGESGGGSYMATADRQGWYRIEEVAEGEYVAEAEQGRVVQTVAVQVAAGRATRLDIELAAAEVRGVVSGIRQGEKAFVMLFPGDSFLAEWSLTAMEALGNQMLNMREVAEDGPFSFTQLNPGEYIIGAVAVSADAQFDAASMMRGRIAVSPVILAAPDTPAEVDLAIE